ncbi:MAG: VWA domain-containing protein [Nitrospinae bacterium]|nr:VWA domain-containing protein [Nitrospinota bacterium]
MRLADPWFLLMLAALPLWWRAHFTARPHGVIFPDTGAVTRLASHKKQWAAHIPFYLRFAAVALIIIAVARPQTGYREEEIVSKGIDIMLALDISSSMSASDLKPTRLDASKKVIGDFIAGRTNDRIGLVVFAAHGFTQCPLTLDYPVLRSFLESSNIGLVEDGTAIGMAIVTAANRLKTSGAKSRIIILLTDGMNNRGSIDPLTAAKVAAAAGVKVYTIGAGKEGVYNQMVNDPRFGARIAPVRTEIDEKLLGQIAQITGGTYFRAEDETGLAEIYRRIDKMEKTDIKVRAYVRHTDWFMYLAVPALMLLMAEMILPATRWRIVP